jgi:hypothetical protein
MLARTGWGRDTMENTSMRGIGKAIVAGVIMIIIGIETVTAIMIMMTGINSFAKAGVFKTTCTSSNG